MWDISVWHKLCKRTLKLFSSKPKFPPRLIASISKGSKSIEDFEVIVGIAQTYKATSPVYDFDTLRADFALASQL